MSPRPIWSLAAFRRWTAQLDAPAILATGTPRAWAQTSFTLALMLVGATQVPGADRFFQLRLVPAAIPYLGVLALVALFWVRQRRTGSPTTVDTTGWLLWTVATSAVPGFAAHLVGQSLGPGAVLFSALLLANTSLAGFSLRVTPAQPYVAVCTAAAISLATLAAPPGVGRLCLFVTGPAAILFEVTFGVFAVRQDEARRGLERFRAAIHAQLLEEKTLRTARLEEALVEVLGRNHDARNTLTAALLDAETLDELLRERDLEAAPIAASLRRSLTQMTALIRNVRDLRGPDELGEAVGTVELASVCDEALAGVQRLYPETRLTLMLEQRDTRVLVKGGSANLRAAVENLLLNACQGSGTQAASNVELAIAPGQDNMVRLVVSDDGPGFPPELLAAPVTPFATTKPNGTGLGLYTTERLVRASGGSLRRGISSLNGAEVEIRLRLADGDSALATSA